MSKRKKLMIQIAEMEKTLVFHQTQAQAHKLCLLQSIERHRLLLVATFMLLPAFFVGWRLARTTKLFSFLKRLLQLGTVHLFAEVEKNFTRYLLPKMLGTGT